MGRGYLHSERVQLRWLAQVYVVSILATFTCITESDNCVMGPGFQIFVDEKLMSFAVSFAAEKVQQLEARYEMGENAPVGIGEGQWIWNLRLEELIPAGNLEANDPTGTFQLKLVSDTVTETYYHCRGTSVRREFTREGLRRIRSGISMLRQEAENE